MTAATLGWFIAGICVTALVTLWFIVSFKELSARRKSLDAINEQVQMHRRLHMQERGGENDAASLAIELLVITSKCVTFVFKYCIV